MISTSPPSPISSKNGTNPPIVQNKSGRGCINICITRLSNLQTCLVRCAKNCRERLNFSPLTVKLFQDSSDGQTRKTLFELHDGHLIEAVLMRYDPNTNSGKGRRTLCISTQAGCAMGCVFCATGQMGFSRHLNQRRDHRTGHALCAGFKGRTA